MMMKQIIFLSFLSLLFLTDISGQEDFMTDITSEETFSEIKSTPINDIIVMSESNK